MYSALMDVSEVTEKLPWLQVTSSSDSESDTGGTEDPLGEDFPAANEAALSFIKMLESVAEYLRATLASEPPVGVLVHSNDEDKSVVPALIMAFLIIHHQCTLSAAYALLEERMRTYSLRLMQPTPPEHPSLIPGEVGLRIGAPVCDQQ